MCLSVPAKVVEVIDTQSVRVDMAGSPRVVNVVMLDAPPALGDWLVVHAGFALGVLEPEEAESALALLQYAMSEGSGLGEEPGVGGPGGLTSRGHL